ncbi:hypothetical protein CF394_05105 [Tetzosporium hominis]|uniref:DUF2207 domain-containing protein n=1 Tax=Tetzosporium hominis TaxID=2020506 RepID=A0A264W6L5_9BACL|nr:DUF2207 domain-containing protein [Tetzosporium hominis]OZS78667.1 hypothetical protein CF394_05105 [Tetzosporium hominis]
MKKNWILSLVVTLTLIGLFPLQALAIDFEIETVRIDAQLNEDGSASVTERFTYAFEEDFNGITRSLIEKEGTAIEEFQAFENGKALRTEFVDGMYRVYRAGDDGDTVTIDLSYTITDVVEKFEDGAQFYYAFFDESNESAYQDLTISVTPPGPSTNTEALGYEEAFGSQTVTEDGTALYEIGLVDEGENGDVRAIFDAELFPVLSTLNGTVRDDMAENIRMQEQAAVFSENQQTASTIAKPAVTGGGTLLLLSVLVLWLRAARRKKSVQSDASGFTVPAETMSIPATLYFTHSAFLSPHVTVAAILDMLRKGNLRQVSEDQFELVDRKTQYAHEETLLKLLVDRIGNGTEFTLTQVKEFTQKTIYHAEYNEAIAKWNKGVRAEVLSHHFYEKHPTLRWIAGISSAAFVGLAVYTAIYDLLPWTFGSVMLAMGTLLLAIFYSPLTREGHEIRSQWRTLKKEFPTVTEEQWKSLTEDERKRAYAYLLGSDSKTATKQATTFHAATSSSDDSSFVMNPVFLTTIFVAANTSTSASASGGATSGGGAGVGGGGGGSGAF